MEGGSGVVTGCFKVNGELGGPDRARWNRDRLLDIIIFAYVCAQTVRSSFERVQKLDNKRGMMVSNWRGAALGGIRAGPGRLCSLLTEFLLEMNFTRRL